MKGFPFQILKHLHKVPARLCTTYVFCSNVWNKKVPKQKVFRGILGCLGPNGIPGFIYTFWGMAKTQTHELAVARSVSDFDLSFIASVNLIT